MISEENKEKFRNQEEALQRFGLIFGFLSFVIVLILILNIISILAFGDFLNSTEQEYYTVFIILTYLSMLVLSIGILVYILPIIPIKNKRLNLREKKDFIKIMEEQYNPTTRRYKIRQILLYVLFASGIGLYLVNLIYTLILFF